MSTETSQDDSYQELQRIYLDWHDGKRPLSGFIEALKARDEAIAVRARQSELDMFRKIPLQAMSKEMAAHVSRRYKALDDTLTQLAGQAEEK